MRDGDGIYPHAAVPPLIREEIGMKTDIMVVGGGGREHAVIKALRKSPEAGRIYAIPGNG